MDCCLVWVLVSLIYGVVSLIATFFERVAEVRDSQNSLKFLRIE
jgi:hypothetical protein